MSIIVTYYRLPAAERERLTRDQTTWEEFRTRDLKARRQALEAALAAIPDGLSQPERWQRVGSALAQSRDPREFDMKKDWQTIGYLLTGQAETHETHREGETLHNAIYGGTSLEVTTGYGPVRCYDERLVTETANALSSFDRSLAAQRFEPRRMRELDIYASPDAREKDGMLSLLDKFAIFFTQASAAKEQVLRYIT